MIRDKRYEKVARLMEHDNDILNAIRMDDNETLLMMAWFVGDKDVVRERFINNCTLLMWACRHGNIDVVRWLIQQNVNLTCEEENGKNVMHVLTFGGVDEEKSLDILEWIKETDSFTNILINKQDVNGNTPLHHAAWHNKHRLLQQFINEGGDVNVRNKKNERPGDNKNCDKETIEIIQRYRK